MGKYDGKKLLILGSNTMAVDIVNYAKANGAYTIESDYLPVEKSRAKQVSDTYLNISTAETAKLVDYCREHDINGIFAGISEFNLLQAYEISKQLGLRFYFDIDQWNNIEIKDQFKQLCKESGVNAPKEHFSGTKSEYSAFDIDNIVFPVVVKPVDCSASRGVTICSDVDTLQIAVEDAFHTSQSGRIIIEQYISGHEFTAHYAICNGKAVLSCVDNRYPIALHEGGVTTLPIARVYPALFQTLYEQKINKQVVKLFESIGLEDAVVFVQGLFNEEQQEFYIFEAGLRSAGEAPCRFLERITGQNQLFMLIDYILLGSTDYISENEDPSLGKKCCAVVSFVSKGGIVGEISGIDYVMQHIPQVIEVENRYPVGAEIPDGDTLRQLMIRFVIICDNREELVDIIELLNTHVQVKDINGNSMVVAIDPKRVLGLE